MRFKKNTFHLFQKVSKRTQNLQKSAKASKTRSRKLLLDNVLSSYVYKRKWKSDSLNFYFKKKKERKFLWRQDEIQCLITAQIHARIRNHLSFEPKTAHLKDLVFSKLIIKFNFYFLTLNFGLLTWKSIKKFLSEQKFVQKDR